MKRTTTRQGFTRRRFAFALLLGFTLTGCQTFVSNSPFVSVGGVWSGAVVGTTSTHRFFRLDVAQTGRRLEGALEARVELPHGWGYEQLGELNGDVRGEAVTFEVRGARQYAGRSLSFSGRVRDGRLEGQLVSQIEERLESGSVVAERR